MTYNIGNLVAQEMAKIVNSQEHQTLFKKASHACCPCAAKCESSCPCCSGPSKACPDVCQHCGSSKIEVQPIDLSGEVRPLNLAGIVDILSQASQILDSMGLEKPSALTIKALNTFVNEMQVKNAKFMDKKHHFNPQPDPPGLSKDDLEDCGWAKDDLEDCGWDDDSDLTDTSSEPEWLKSFLNEEAYTPADQPKDIFDSNEVKDIDDLPEIGLDALDYSPHKHKHQSHRHHAKFLEPFNPEDLPVKRGPHAKFLEPFNPEALEAKKAFDALDNWIIKRTASHDDSFEDD